jgi:hypothetical protein
MGLERIGVLAAIEVRRIAAPHFLVPDADRPVLTCTGCRRETVMKGCGSIRCAMGETYGRRCPMYRRAAFMDKLKQEGTQ